MDGNMASTMKMITSSSNSSSNNFVANKTLYTETTTTVTTRQTKVNSNDYTTPNIKNMLERQNSSLYTGSIFAALDALDEDMQVKILVLFVSIFALSMVISDLDKITRISYY